MFNQLVQQALGIHENTDAVLICDKKGIIEYAKWKKNVFFVPSEVAGRSILDIYPGLNEKTSTIMRVLNTGQPLYEEEQRIYTWKNELVHCVSTTLPIKANGKVIGAICASILYNSDEKPTLDIPSGEYYQLSDIIAQDEKMIELKRRIEKAAMSDSAVMIIGETGTGKELVAQSVHSCSMRRDKPFISQNCAAIPTSLLEGIFFGTEKGSYTGAENRKGLFELADGGTLFLDEINSMDISIQAKLLKALEEKKIRHVGGYKEIKFDVKIVCAMNEEPLEAIKKGVLREDLYYRLSVVKLQIPPLRERKGDILLLTDYYIQYFNRKMGKHITGASELVQNALMNCEWKGNVRELKNVIESAFNLAEKDVITMKDIPELAHQTQKTILNAPKAIPNRTGSLKNMMDDYEKLIIEETLKNSKTMAEAAEKLDMSRQNLRYKIKRYNL